MSNEFNIDAALNNHLLAMPDRVPTAWPNKAFDPQGAPVWIRVDHLPRQTDAPALGDASFQDYGGVYQISVMATQGEYAADALEEADRIMSHFARGTELEYNGTGVRLRNSYRSPGLQDGSYYSIPVSIRYRAII